MSRLLNINLIYGFRPVNCFFHKLRTFHTSWETLKKESSCKILKANGLFKEQPSPTSRCGRVWGLDSAQTRAASPPPLRSRPSPRLSLKGPGGDPWPSAAAPASGLIPSHQD